MEDKRKSLDCQALNKQQKFNLQEYISIHLHLTVLLTSRVNNGYIITITQNINYFS